MVNVWGLPDLPDMFEPRRSLWARVMDPLQRQGSVPADWCPPPSCGAHQRCAVGPNKTNRLQDITVFSILRNPQSLYCWGFIGSSNLNVAMPSIGYSHSFFVSRVRIAIVVMTASVSKYIHPDQPLLRIWNNVTGFSRPRPLPLKYP